MKYLNKMNKALLWGTLILLLTFTLLTPVSHIMAQICVQPPNNLVSWWPLDGNANDIQDNNPATLFGNPSFTAGEVDQALQFDGVDDHAKVPTSANLNVSTGSGLTIDTWIKPSDVSVKRPLVEWNNSVGGIGAHFWIAVGLAGGGPGSLYANLPETPSECCSKVISSAPGILTANTLQHVAVTYDKTTGLARLYRNGVVVAQQNLGIFTPHTSFDLFFGLRPSGSSAGTRYVGTMDEIEIFNRALTQNEIQAIYNAGSAGKCKGTDIPLIVTSTNPAGNDRVIASEGIISATFNRAVNNSTVSSGTFTVRGQQTGIYGGSYTFDSVQSVQFDATNDFKPGEEIVVNLNSGLKATDGAALTPYVWQFRAAVGGGNGILIDSGQRLGNSASNGVRLGDLDGDGDLDAFIANYDQANKVWLNNGAGTFSDTGQNLGSASSQGLALGDVDSDGDLDAFVANYGLPDKVWLNNGSGTFSDSGQSLGSSASREVALGDLDGDGDLDAFVVNTYPPGTGANKVWLNNGAGAFSDSGQSLGNSNSNGVVLGDFDNDGDLDAFIANGAPQADDEVWLNDGLGNFIDSGQSLDNIDSQFVAMGDLDSDGDLDAFVANSGPDKVWLNDGSGTFSDSGQSLGNSGSRAVALGDMDGDSDLDAFIANFDQANEIWLNDGTGIFSDSGQSLGSSGNQEVALGDLDEDGDLDAFIAKWANPIDRPNEIWLNDPGTSLAGLLSCWPGDGNADDISGNSNHGVLQNGATFAPGMVGQAFTFDGIDDYVEVPASANLNFGTGDFTVAFWVKFNDLVDADNGLLHKDTYSGGPLTANGWLFNICGACGSAGGFGTGSGGIGLETRNLINGVGPHTHARYATSNFQTGVWYHIAGVRSSNVLHHYVDGVIRATTAEPSPTDVSNNVNLQFGRVNVAPQWFNGQLDEIEIYNSALSAEEIQAIFEAESTGGAGTCKGTIVGINITTGSPLSDGTVEEPYSVTLEAEGGTPPYTWSIASGALPSGLILDPLTGLISGTPTLAGAFNFTVQVADSTSATATKEFTLTIQVPPLIIITASPLPSGTIGVPYSVTLEAIGGTPPYVWSIAAGALPPGLSLDPVTGIISGTPTTAGTFGFTVQVADSSAVIVTKQFTVAPPPSSGTAGSSYTVPISVPDTPPDDTGGTSECSNYELVSGTLPDGLMLDPNTGIISGTPTDGGTYTFTVQCVVVGTGQTATKEFTITIYNPLPTLTSLDPSAATAGGGEFILTVYGTNFVNSSMVQWNGASRLTTYVSATQLTAQIGAADIALEGTASVTVVNPAPNGGTSNALTFTIEPPNQPPTANADGPYNCNEGSDCTFNGSSSSDPDPGDSIVLYEWDFDYDGITFDVDATGVQPTVSFADNFPERIIALRVTDSGGLADLDDATTLEVTNMKPAVDPPMVAPEPSDEGGAVTTSATFSDPGVNDAPFTCMVDYGDGLGHQPGTVSGNTCIGPAHTYADNGSYPVTISVTDKDTDTGSNSTSHVVNNVAPTVDAEPDAMIFSGETFAVNASFTDPGIPDTHTATINFGTGDGPEPATVSQGAGSGTVTGSRRYFLPNFYAVEVCVTDDDGGTGCDNFALEVKPFPVAIDIKPGSDPNCFNSDGHGVIPVAILSSPDFDATQVDPATVSLDGQGVRVVGKGSTQAHQEDVNGDGLVDLVVQIEDRDGTYQAGDTPATLTGVTFEGIHIEGTDSICIVP
jgi:hypothetical protein